MPAQSKAQQRAAAIALEAKRGHIANHELKGPSKEMEASMTEKELKEFASTPIKHKPEHVSKS
jgi:hypothetical protein